MFPAACALAIVLGAVLEAAVFRHAYLLADRSTLAVAHKATRLERGLSDNVLILGPSTAMAIDAAALQRSAGNRLTFYNYALPNMGTTEQYYFVLKKYLLFNRKPDVVVLAVPPETIFDEAAEDTEALKALRGDRFRRFFGPLFLLREVAPKTHDWAFVAQGVTTALPSVNYRLFIKNSTFARVRELWDLEDIRSTRQLIGRNRGLLDRLDATRGQMVFNENRTVESNEIPAMTPSRTGPTFIEDVIRLAAASDIPTRLIWTPICCEARDEEWRRAGAWSALASRLAEYERRYPTFHFVDAGERSYGREYFGDPTHVNARGARRLTDTLAGRVAALIGGAN